MGFKAWGETPESGRPCERLAMATWPVYHRLQLAVVQVPDDSRLHQLVTWYVRSGRDDLFTEPDAERVERVWDREAALEEWLVS